MSLDGLEGGLNDFYGHQEEEGEHFSHFPWVEGRIPRGNF